MEATVDQSAVKTHPTNRLADKLKLRKAYVRGEGSLADLCNNLSISYQTAHVWFTAEKWQKLKTEHDVRELVKLTGGKMPDEAVEQPASTSSSSVTELQLQQVNDSILACDDANEIAKLTRAKLDLTESLWIERYGSKPGTQRPARAGKPRGSQRVPEPTETPQPVQNQVQDPTEPNG